MIELGHLTDRRPPFKYAAYTRVAFSDTDAQGVVYYGRYAAYRCDEDGVADVLMATAKQTLVLIELAARRPIPVPESFRARVSEFEG